MKSRPLARSFLAPAILFVALIGGGSSAHAVSEKEYATTYLDVVAPFLSSGEVYLFRTRDGINLSGVRFIHPNSRGTILVLSGRSETWLKYGEVFYDLYQQGYSLFSYDHRGQGLSPHFVSSNRQIGHIDRFKHYVEDLEDFIESVLIPEVGDTNLYLLAHSMGGAIGAEYLSRGKTPFKAAVLSAPMLTINTKPYPSVIAEAIAGAAMGVGFSKSYAPGRGNYDPNLPFEKNDAMGSPERFWMSNVISLTNPASVIGGPSNGWVYRSLFATPKIVRHMKSITTPVLMFQAGLDQLVKPKGETVGCASTKACKLVVFPGSQHEILMEKDVIRDEAFSRIEKFFH